jgi:hypothetical protein
LRADAVKHVHDTITVAIFAGVDSAIRVGIPAA